MNFSVVLLGRDENPKDKPICCKTLVFQHRACRHLWSIIWLRDATQRDHASCLGELATPCGTSAPLWQFDGSGGKSSPGNVALPFWHVPCPLGESPWVFKTNVVYRAAPPPRPTPKPYRNIVRVNFWGVFLCEPCLVEERPNCSHSRQS